MTRLGAVYIIRHAFLICLKRDKNKIVVKLTTTKLQKQKKSRVRYYLNSPLLHGLQFSMWIGLNVPAPERRLRHQQHVNILTKALDGLYSIGRGHVLVYNNASTRRETGSVTSTRVSYVIVSCASISIRVMLLLE